MSFDGMTSDQFNTHHSAITEEVANNIGKEVDDVTLTQKSNSDRRRRMNGNM